MKKLFIQTAVLLLLFTLLSACCEKIISSSKILTPPLNAAMGLSYSLLIEQYPIIDLSIDGLECGAKIYSA